MVHFAGHSPSAKTEGVFWGKGRETYDYSHKSETVRIGKLVSCTFACSSNFSKQSKIIPRAIKPKLLAPKSVECRRLKSHAFHAFVRPFRISFVDDLSKLFISSRWTSCTSTDECVCIRYIRSFLHLRCEHFARMVPTTISSSFNRTSFVLDRVWVRHMYASSST